MGLPAWDNAMDNEWTWVLYLVFAVVLIGVFYIVDRAAKQREKQRREDLSAEASRLGFEFRPEFQPQLVDRLVHFGLFSRGHSRRAWNVMDGRAGDVKVLLFDYVYVTGSGKYRQAWMHTMILFESGRLQLPAFSLRPSSFRDKIANAFGQQDIEVEASPEFSAAYVLQGEDEDLVRGFFPESVVAYCTRHPGLWVEGKGEQLVYCGGRIVPAEMAGFFQEGLDVLDLWIEKEGVAENLDLIGLDRV